MSRPEISLRAAIGSGSPYTNPFIIGSSLIGGTDVLTGRAIVGQGSWEELGDRCLRVQTRRGRQRALDGYAAGTLSAELDNSDGELDPTYTAGTYSSGGVSRVRSMAGVDLTATYEGVTYDIWSGFADNWMPRLGYPEGGGTTLTATDAFKIFAGINPAEQSSQGAGELTGARIERILELAGWSSTLRDVDAGVETHQATTLAQPILTQLRLAADSEAGHLYMGADGKVTFRSRRSRLVNPRSTISQWTFGDASDDSEICPVAMVPSNSDDVTRNDWRVARTGGTEVIRQHADVVTAPYIARTFTRSDLSLETDAQVTAFAERGLRIFGESRPRVESMVFEPDGRPDQFPVLLSLLFGDRVTVNVRHPRTGNLWSQDYFVEGVDHDIPVRESGGKWRTTVWLADATKFPTEPFIIGQSLIGSTAVLV